MLLGLTFWYLKGKMQGLPAAGPLFAMQLEGGPGWIPQSGLLSAGQWSQASPILSPSVSSWSELRIDGQLSQASPTPSPSASFWLGFGVVRQLSMISLVPSLSKSVVVSELSVIVAELFGRDVSRAYAKA